MNLKHEDRMPLSKLQIIQEQSTPQRKAKIFSRKLPDDFFLQKSLPIKINHNQMNTQTIHRKLSDLGRVSNTREVNNRAGQSTGRLLRAQQDDAIDLLRGVIATSRQMRKMIRRHSVQMKKQNNNVRENDQYKLELPPLLLKKGATVAF